MSNTVETVVIPFTSNETVITAELTDSSANLFSNSWLSPDATKDFVGEFDRHDLLQLGHELIMLAASLPAATGDSMAENRAAYAKFLSM